MPPHTTPVVAGVLCRHPGLFLAALRPAHKPLGGYWEFPGGKVADGEGDTAALRRELHEELGIRILSAAPLVCSITPTIHCRVFSVTAWCGTPHGAEGQTVAWLSLDDLAALPLTPATAVAAARLYASPPRLPGPRSGLRLHLRHTENRQ